MRVGCLAACVQIVERRDAGKREVAAPPRELVEAPAPLRRPGGQAHLDDDLVVGQRRGKCAGEEAAGGNDALAFRAENADLGVAGHRDAGHLGRRIGMREAAADGAAVADLVVRDMLDRGAEQRVRALQPLVVLDVAPARTRTQAHAVFRDGDLLQLLQLADVDQHRRRGEAKRHRRQEALGAVRKDRHRLDFHQRSRNGERGNHEHRAGGCLGRRELLAHGADGRNVGLADHIGRGLHQMVIAQPHGGEREPDVVPDLAVLRHHVAFADQLARLVARHLARDVKRLGRAHAHRLRIHRAGRRGQGRRVQVFGAHGRSSPLTYDSLLHILKREPRPRERTARRKRRGALRRESCAARTRSPARLSLWRARRASPRRL